MARTLDKDGKDYKHERQGHWTRIAKTINVKGKTPKNKYQEAPPHYSIYTFVRYKRARKQKLK